MNLMLYKYTTSIGNIKEILKWKQKHDFDQLDIYEHQSIFLSINSNING